MKRRRKITGFVAFGVVLLASVVPGVAEIHHGVGNLSVPMELPTWDFSAQSVVEYPDGDIMFAHELDLGFIVFTLQAQGIQAIHGTTFEDLTEAPADLSTYGDYASVDIIDFSTVYVVHTSEGHFAKFRLLPSGFMIEYSYQDDGSRFLGSGTPVQAATWGAVKEQFR